MHFGLLKHNLIFQSLFFFPHEHFWDRTMPINRLHCGSSLENDAFMRTVNYRPNLTLLEFIICAGLSQHLLLARNLSFADWKMLSLAFSLDALFPIVAMEIGKAHNLFHPHKSWFFCAHYSNKASFFYTSFQLLLFYFYIYLEAT